MTVSIMQPYFFPYLGYFQLINAADLFIVYDTIQYTKKGWINRNRFLLNGRDEYFTLPIKKGSDHLFVSSRELSGDFETHADYLIRLFSNTYKKAPFFDETMQLFQDTVLVDERNLFRFILQSIVKICAYLDIATPLKIASDFTIDETTKGVERVIALTKAASGTTYRNPNGAAHLYSGEYFKSIGLGLEILKMDALEYPQFGNPFIPSLSVLDVLMFNGKAETRELLNRFSITKP